jgi:hypothetical protein
MWNWEGEGVMMIQRRKGCEGMTIVWSETWMGSRGATGP